MAESLFYEGATSVHINEDDARNYSVLIFPKSWIGTKLPPASQHPVLDKDKGYPPEAFEDLFQIVLLDTQDGKEYTIPKYYQAYEQYPYDAEHTSVSQYFYSCHFCECHRKCEVIGLGADTDEECVGRRFKVVSVTAPKYLPGLILYSETIGADELNEKLKEVCQKLGL